MVCCLECRVMWGVPARGLGGGPSQPCSPKQSGLLRCALPACAMRSAQDWHRSLVLGLKASASGRRGIAQQTAHQLAEEHPLLVMEAAPMGDALPVVSKGHIQQLAAQLRRQTGAEGQS